MAYGTSLGNQEEKNIFILLVYFISKVHLHRVFILTVTWFRVENEHLNNVGKYRAFKSVPLPFNYDEDDEDGDKEG